MRIRPLPLLLAFGITLPAQAPEALMARLPADTTSLLVVRDPMPHVDAMLESPLLGDLLSSSTDLQEELFGRWFDSRTLSRQVGLFRDLVPTEVVIAGSATTVADLVRALQVATAYGLLPLLPANDEVADEMRANAATALREFGRCDLVAWVRLRDERTAENWFDRLVEGVAAAPDDASLEVETAADRLTIRMSPLRWSDGTLRQQLVARGVDVPDTVDPRLVASVVQRGAELELRIGEPTAGPLAAARLGPLWQPDAGQWLFGTFDADAAGALVDQYVDELWALTEAIEDQDLAGRLAAFADQSSWLTMPMAGSVRIDNGLVMTQESVVEESATHELAAPDAAVVRCVAPDEGPFVLSALTLDVLLAGTMQEIALQLARRGRELPSELDDAGDFLAGEESALFAPGMLIAMRPAQCRGVAAWELGAMPFASVAVVAKAHDAASAGTFVHELSGRLQSAFGIEGELWRDADLGLTVPTQELDVARLVPAFPGMGVDADFRPHWFAVDGVLVLSTDPKLSVDLIARMRATAVPALPARKLVDWTHWVGRDLSDVCAAGARWWRAVPESVRPTERVFLNTDRLLGSLVALSQVVEAIETVSELDGTTYREVTRLRLRTPK